MNKIILHAEDLDGFLTEEDKINIQDVHALYDKSLDACTKIDKDPQDEAAKDELSDSAAEIGAKLKEICSSNDRIHVYSFETPGNSMVKPAESLQNYVILKQDTKSSSIISREHMN